MSRGLLRFTLAGAMLAIAGGLASAQTTTTTETKSFEVIGVRGNDLVVKLPEGTKSLTVPEDFRFTVDGQQMSVHQLKAGMKGTAQITTKTTSHPVTVTEVKNGTVRMVSGSSMIVQTDEGFKSFTQTEVDKRGVSIMRNGEPAQLSDFHAGDKLSATIVTTRPPRVVTEKAVEAELARANASGGSGSASGGGGPAGRSATSGSSGGSSTLASSQSAGASGTPGGSSRKLPKTATQFPLVGLIGIGALASAFALRARRRRLVQ